MKEDLDQRAQELAVYVIENRATIRAAAKHFGISKSTVHKDLSERLYDCNRSLYSQVREILLINKAERHPKKIQGKRLKLRRRSFSAGAVSLFLKQIVFFLKIF